MGMISQEIVRDFRGEDRLHPDEILAPNVSPDAQNVDYSARTIKRRDGYVRLHDISIKTGGVLIDNTATSNKCIQIPGHSDYVFAAQNWCVELRIQLLEDPPSEIEIVSFLDAAGLKGWKFTYHPTNGLTIWWTHGAGQSASSPGTQLLTVGVNHHIAVVLSESAPGVSLYLDGVAATAAGTTSGATVDPSREIYVGCSGDGATPQNQDSGMIVDDIRIWKDVRTSAEINAWKDSELSSAEAADSNLVGYWKCNEGRGITVGDSHSNANDGVLFGAGFTIENGIVPEQEGDGFAFRGDGSSVTDGYSSSRSAAIPDTIWDTGNTWTVELWARLDNANIDGGERLVSMGDFNATPGSVMELFIDSSKNLTLGYSTASTHDNATDDTTYDVVAGTAFHVAVVRDTSTIYTYINGVLVRTLTGVTTEAGPDSAPGTNWGIVFCGRYNNGIDSLGPFTVDECRVWSIARNAQDILDWYDSTFPDTKKTGLELYYRFDAEDFRKNEVGDKNVTTLNDEILQLASIDNNPRFTFGLVASGLVGSGGRITLSAPLIMPVSQEPTTVSGDTVVLAYVTSKRKDILTATESTYSSVMESKVRQLKDFKRYGRDTYFDWCQYNRFLVACNGIEEVQKYDTGELPTTFSIAAVTTQAVASPTGAGSGWGGVAGAYTYAFSYRNERDGTESLQGVTVGGTMVATNDTMELSNIPDTCPSDDAQVTQIRIYRKDPVATGTAVFRFLADVDYGTTTYSDDGSSVATNDLIDNNRGHVPESRYCAVYVNRCFFLNASGAPSDLNYTEAGSNQIPATNNISVDKDDGDEGTGIHAAYGGLLVFKEKSVHFLTGYGITTFNVNKNIDGLGCVAGQTLAQGPLGVYFLGYDGVYLMPDPSHANYVSLSQQSVFLDIDTSKKRLSTGVYDPKTHQYIVSFDTNTDGRITMVYDEETGSWAKWGIGFDTLELSEDTSSAKATVIGTRNGYVVRLFDGTQDGTQIDGGASTTHTGSGISVTSTDDSLTDGGASFPTTNDGLRGVPCLIVDSAGLKYSKTIVNNTGTILYFDSAIGVTDTVSYFVGAIDFHWESPWMDMGDPALIKRLYKIYTWQTEGSATIVLKHKTDQYETFVETSFSDADEFAKSIANNRGHKLKFRIEYYEPGKAIEVRAFQGIFSPRGFN